MLDRTIPYSNVIMRCSRVLNNDYVLPSDYYFEYYKDGYEDYWAELEYKIGDFASVKEARKYFVNTYLGEYTLLSKRCIFVFNADKKCIGSCIAWHDFSDDNNVNTVASLHWLVVDECYQGIGIGKALCNKALKIFEENYELPVYLHTQPWSYKAIMLYSQLGFNILRSDTFSNYINEFDKSLGILKSVLSNEKLEALISNVE